MRTVRNAFRKLKHRIRIAQLNGVARTLIEERLTFLSPGALKLLEDELRSVISAGVHGDICEFGLAWGGSAALLTQQASEQHPYHGFDVFSMIPEPTSEKDGEKSKARYRDIAEGRAKGIGNEEYYGYRADSFGKVKALLARFGRPVDERTVFLHKGLFSETLPHYQSGKVAFAHIDCDWYEPTKECLDAIHDRLQVGGKMIIDDYPGWPGCKAAVDEFLAVHGAQYDRRMKSRLVLTRTA